MSSLRFAGFKPAACILGFGDLSFEGPGERGGGLSLREFAVAWPQVTKHQKFPVSSPEELHLTWACTVGLETETLTPCTNHIGDARSRKCHAYSLHFHVQFLETRLPADNHKPCQTQEPKSCQAQAKAPERHPRVVGPRPHVPKKQIQARSAGRHPAAGMRRIHFIAEPPKAKQLFGGLDLRLGSLVRACLAGEPR